MLSKYFIVVDGYYYCGEDELVSNSDKLPSPWSANSFQVKNNGVSKLKFGELEEAKLIEGRNNLVSHVRKILDYVLSNEKTPNSIHILRQQEAPHD